MSFSNLLAIFCLSFAHDLAVCGCLLTMIRSSSGRRLAIMWPYSGGLLFICWSCFGYHLLAVYDHYLTGLRRSFAGLLIVFWPFFFVVF